MNNNNNNNNNMGQLVDIPPKCHKCNKDIVGQGIRAAGYQWHPKGCFTCSFCNVDIVSTFLEKYQRIFCLSCDKKLFGQYCGESTLQPVRQGGCGQCIETEDFVNFDNIVFHKNCVKQ